MAEISYDWKRYWVPREGRMPCDESGFLIPPAADASWAKWYSTDAAGFEELNKKPCLVLLGEPGIGKSFALKDAENSARKSEEPGGARFLTRNLNIFDAGKHLVTEIFEGPDFRWWETGGGQLHVFLDSFDECLFRVDTLAELLSGRIMALRNTHNLFFRIACRTAEWRTNLEDSLRQKWDDKSVGVYELCPLTEKQVRVAAEARSLDTDRFIASVKSSEAVPFAVKPLTLELLFRIWKSQGGRLPPTQKEIYEKGCLELCRDSPDRQTPKLQRKFSAEERLTVASHIAAAMIFCKKSAIATSSRGDVADADISLDELAEASVLVKRRRLPITEPALKETLDSGLFTSRGRNRLGWAHQTYAEFLAARFLVNQGLTVRQVMDLLTHPGDSDHKMVPQLQETAAWVAGANREIFESLVNIQPDVMLRSDVATADYHAKEILIDALLNYVGRDFMHGDPRLTHTRYRKLSHPKLAVQLRGYLRNTKFAHEVRLEAMRIAGECETRELLKDFIDLALSPAENQTLRTWAIIYITKFGDEKTKEQLKPVALGQCGPDLNDELRGGALSACWPNHVTAKELFPSLKEPDGGHIGLYSSFFRNSLVRGLSDDDLPLALAWVEKQSSPRSHASDSFTIAVGGIVSRAHDLLHLSEIRIAYARAFLVQFRTHCDIFDHDTAGLNHFLQTHPTERLHLVQTMVSLFENPRMDAPVMTRYGILLVVKEDLKWLLEQIELAQSETEKRGWVYLVGYIYSPETSAQADLLLDAAAKSPLLSEVMAFWLKTCDLDAKETISAREVFLAHKRSAEQAEERQKKGLQTCNPDEKIARLMGDFEQGNRDAWWQMTFWFERKDDQEYHSNHSTLDIRSLPFWKNAPDDIKRRIVASANIYVREGDCKPSEWFGRRDIVYHPAVAGFRALLLLQNEAPDIFNSLPAEAWRKWIPIILHCPNYIHQCQHIALTEGAFKHCPAESVEWLLKVFDQETKQGEHPWVLQVLPKKDAGLWGPPLFERLKGGKVRPLCAEQLTQLLIKTMPVELLDFIRSKVPRCVPKTEKKRRAALFHFRLLMEFGEFADWPKIKKLVWRDPVFGRELFEGFAHEYDRAPAAILETLHEDDVAELWSWMMEQYPVTTDPDRSRGGSVTPRWAMANLRDNIISHLASLGTNASCKILADLLHQHPDLSEFLSWQLSLAKERARRNTWKPLSPTQLFALAESPQRRIVQSANQLMQVVVESLDLFQETLQGENPLAHLLWAGNHPKLEKDLCDWLADHLKKELAGKGIVVGREVQIHRLDRLDLRIDAIAEPEAGNALETVRVIVEVKGCWNRKIKEAMGTQLVHKYLKDRDCQHGLYVVGWFLCNAWTGKNPSRNAVKFANIDEMKKFFFGQAGAFSANGRRIKSVVLDITTAAATKASRKKRRGH